MSTHTEDCKSTSCTYCNQYLKYIQKLQSLLDDNEIEYQKMRIKKDKSLPSEVMSQIDLTEGRLEYLVSEFYTEETFLKGYKGVIDFIHNYVVRDDETSEIVYICSDSTKKIFQYYDVEGLQKDIRCKILMDSIYDPLIKKVNKIYRILINKIYQDDDILVVGGNSYNSDSDDDSDDYDSDIEEIIAEELHDKKKQKDAEIVSKTIDELVNNTVATFLEIKKCIGKVRKPVVDELVSLLAL